MPTGAWTAIARKVERYAADTAQGGPAERLHALVNLRDDVEHLIDREVLRARERGLSWSVIGEALGVGSKQAGRWRHQAALRREQARQAR